LYSLYQPENVLSPHTVLVYKELENLTEVKVFNILVSSMSDMNNKWDIPSSMSELESLGLETPKLNELNDSYEVENLVVNLKQMFYQEYKSTDVFTD
jgi:hypothetical protein